ncbi:hypothetical protein [Dyella lutea]|uniref:Uncharacterized protein n=1 Tax=Dyella lutea TaxID=2950441 RepID=A0ABT1FF44_9GAMM|nr:hypothetical protein [Dyella lutea]MCP1376013.1 hypothetical protein [Dyella lutea]
MITLGSTDRGAVRLAMAARDAVVVKGQCAVFVSRKTGEAVAVPYIDPSYDWLLRKHAEHLVGVYTDPGYKTSTLRQQLLEDINHHLKPARQGRAA